MNSLKEKILKAVKAKELLKSPEKALMMRKIPF